VLLWERPESVFQQLAEHAEKILLAQERLGLAGAEGRDEAFTQPDMAHFDLKQITKLQLASYSNSQ
jgi:hypothetical protein